MQLGTQCALLVQLLYFQRGNTVNQKQDVRNRRQDYIFLNRNLKQIWNLQIKATFFNQTVTLHMICWGRWLFHIEKCLQIKWQLHVIQSLYRAVSAGSIRALAVCGAVYSNGLALAEKRNEILWLFSKWLISPAHCYISVCSPACQIPLKPLHHTSPPKDSLYVTETPQ